ncbi:uncharacterized protein LOC143212412 [Lasioglossum baleicum]|uniref:uncharacterized protein LOC143212412 n=1 Tax=Lasioglossum baleicum TaxID=434251 RepID=UPI003FCD33D8
MPAKYKDALLPVRPIGVLGEDVPDMRLLMAQSATEARRTPSNLARPYSQLYREPFDSTQSEKQHEKRSTRWPEATTPIPDTSADTVVNAFFATWVATFGAPAVITTDRGAQFESLLFQALTKLIGSQRIRTTAYHPQSNGIIERWHRLRISYKDDIKASAAEMVFGTTLRILGEFFAAEDPIGCPQIFIEKLREHIRTIRPTPTSHHAYRKPFVYKELEDCTYVFVRVDKLKTSLELPYEGPYQIIERLTDFLYKINYKGVPTTINIDRLKPAFLENVLEDQPTTKYWPPTKTIPDPEKWQRAPLHTSP